MCGPGIGSSVEHEITIHAPCGKKVALAFPDSFKQRGTDEDVGAALGMLVSLMGYERRGWQLNIKRTVRTVSQTKSEISTEERSIWSR